MSIAQVDQHTYFPWRDGNRFQLLVDGNEFYPVMLSAIDGACTHVLLEMYLIESGDVANRFIDAFCAAVARGVTVYLLLDDFGARGIHHKDRERLRGGGVKLECLNRLDHGRLRRNFLRDHRKLLLVDGLQAFVGGAGITDEFDPPGHPERRWRETMVRILGPVVLDWQRLFVFTCELYTLLTLPTLPAPATKNTNTQHNQDNKTHDILHPE